MKLNVQIWRLILQSFVQPCLARKEQNVVIASMESVFVSKWDQNLCFVLLVGDETTVLSVFSMPCQFLWQLV